MRQIYVLDTVRGARRLYNDTVRWHHMATERAKERLRIISFCEKHGIEATVDAFHVSKRTLYRWKAKLRGARGHVDGLNERSTAPLRRRKRVYPPGFLEQVIELRRVHDRTGKKKLAALLNVSESYAGRTLSDLKKRGLLPGEKKLSLMARSGKLIERKPLYRKKIRRSHKRGIEVDTIIRFVDGIKRYVYTAIDVEKKFAFAAAYTNHSSASAADFLGKLRIVAPFGISEVQTDNGSEFALRFEEACTTLSITHFHTYPRSPKMNAHIERFNRTLSEDFIRHHRGVLRDDLTRFNELLIDWLLWYNTERPHESLGMLSPLRYIVRDLTAHQCQMWWTRTFV
jgi:transposase InsO family protein